MQIVIPMSGFGERFRRAGFTVPKPLVEVDGKPIIAHVVDLFPGADSFVFVCNAEHLAAADYDMKETLEAIAPGARIVAIQPHRLGPVHAVLEAADAIDPDAPVIVNYCDFACYWDFDHFRNFVARSAADGAVACYRGFHPHMLGSTNYAYVRDVDGWATDIQEKQPFTATPMAEFASSGTYYYRSGALMLDAFRRTMGQGLSVNDEYYVSLTYKPLLADGRRVAVYELQHFMQWGTPEDLAEYRSWSEAFGRLAKPAEGAGPAQAGTVLMPMAGLGSRFEAEGYDRPKPLIPVSGKPMAVQAARDLPRAEAHVFALRRELSERPAVEAALRGAFPECRIVLLDAATDGQARTCLLALEGVDPEAPLTIAACDTGALYDAGGLQALLADDAADVVVWAARRHPPAARRPEMYGWIEADAAGRVRGVSVKVPLAAPESDPIVIGTFTFKRARDFAAAAEAMIDREARVNGEFYVDTCINDAIQMGLDVRLFEIDHYLCWGTPEELRSFEYWQSCFHKWPSHPYSLAADGDVPADAVAALEKRYQPCRPPLPGSAP
ncbi:MAG: NTP transferase domain-containing protein [Alphaproteobacteria bacterium]|jgi:NDP-sugar pyrophosphorylase family protein|nr:NTP transferase domain-containing protein [Alphaproteobacteria bacterium]